MMSICDFKAVHSGSSSGATALGGIKGVEASFSFVSWSKVNRSSFSLCDISYLFFRFFNQRIIITKFTLCLLTHYIKFFKLLCSSFSKGFLSTLNWLSTFRTNTLRSIEFKVACSCPSTLSALELFFLLSHVNSLKFHPLSLPFALTEPP